MEIYKPFNTKVVKVVCLNASTEDKLGHCETF